MKRLIKMLCLGIMISCSNNNEYIESTKPYFGQMPNPECAELFLPEMFPEGQFQGCSGFLDSGKVFVFASMKPNSDWRFRPVYVMYLKEKGWTKPEIAPFNNYFPYNFTVGPDDQILYFTSMKSPDKNTSQILENANIWAVKWEDGNWTEPVMFGNSINTEKYYENYPSVTNNGIIYYMSRRPDGVGKTDLYYSINYDGVYGEAKNIGIPVNTKDSDIDSFIAPDESYLIVCQNNEDSYGKFDLYIYFKKEDGSWTNAINMGSKVNSQGFEARPYVTPDGKYLFFTSSRNIENNSKTIYWIGAELIEELKANIKI